MKEELVKFLEKDIHKIQGKMGKALELGDVGTYRNLMKTLAEATDLIRKNEWKLKYSEYETDGHKEVAVWEQNYDGEIRNHKKWAVNGETKSINSLTWSFDFYIKNNMVDGVCEIPIVDSMRGIGKSYYMQSKIKEDGNVYVSYRNALCTSENKINIVNLSKSHSLESVLNTTTIKDAKRLYIDEGVTYDIREIRKANPTCEIVAYKRIDK